MGMSVDEALASWLGLRESADFAARSPRVFRAVADAVDDHQPRRVLDLGTGTGSNVRYLGPLLRGRQHWLVVDRSATLLELVASRLASWAAAQGSEFRADGATSVIRNARVEIHVETRCMDLGALDGEIFAGRHLVTASALLDLASEEWMATLAGQCRAARAAGLFAITYNGESTCVPREAEDDTIRELLNRHQHRNKGLGGPAEGPGAAACVARCFAREKYQVVSSPSDWVLGPSERELQRQLVDGWASAATEMEPQQAAAIGRWRTRRLAHVETGQSRITVGHVDVAAWLPRDP
jgi:hypothetical protein